MISRPSGAAVKLVWVGIGEVDVELGEAAQDVEHHRLPGLEEIGEGRRDSTKKTSSKSIDEAAKAVTRWARSKLRQRLALDDRLRARRAAAASRSGGVLVDEAEAASAPAAAPAGSSSGAGALRRLALEMISSSPLTEPDPGALEADPLDRSGHAECRR